MKIVALSALIALLSAPTFADSHASGNAAAGEAAFAKQCVSCHVVVNDAGETLAGRKGKTGPNLYGVAGRVVGSLPGFRYGTSIAAVGETGRIWTEDDFVTYVQDPTAWLRATLDDKKARSKMSFKLRSAEDAANIYAFLASIGPEMPVEAPASN